ncbi:MAG: branched-chain-amino-acid transaminase [Candidatus Poribacteria bacterium]|nr:branched-chain-amino-acid transaminase [Candidatus Poribacteria bacterium]
MLVYVDGAFVPIEQAGVSVFDHGVLYGDGVFEGIRAYNGRVFRLEQHLRRLYDSIKATMLPMPLTRDEMGEIVLESLRRNGLKDAYIRLVVTRGVGDLGLDPAKCKEPSVFCIAGEIALYPPHYYSQGLELTTAATRRTQADALDPRIKTLNYMNNLFAKIEGKSAGSPEAVMLNAQGYVVECTTENLFYARRGRLFTPPKYVGALEGITRGAVIDLAKEAGIAVVEQPFTRFDLYTADECFVTGTGAEIVPVVKVDGRVVGNGIPGEMTRKLTEAFKALARSTGTPIYSL